MPARKSSSADVRRQEILDAAARCVSAYGLEGTTLQRIADEAGITRSNLAHFIGSRDEIVDAAFTQGIQNFVVDMKARVAGLAPPERLPAFIESLLDNPAEVPRSAAKLNALSAAAEHDEHARDVLSEGLRDVDAWVREMIEDRYPRAPAVRWASDNVVSVRLTSSVRPRAASTRASQSSARHSAHGCTAIRLSSHPR